MYAILYLMPEKITDPTQVKVQLNIPVTWEFREHLTKIAADRHVSMSALIREALQRQHPMGIENVREETAAAGATR